jgi:hypothetical protein
VKNVFVALSLLSLLVLLGCDSRNELPAVLGITPPPQPANLNIQKTSPTMYELTWTIDNPTAVSEFRVYSVGPFGPPELIGATDQTQTDVDTVIPVTGIVFGVSSVTVENVESDLTSVAAPDTILTANSIRFK